jgi:hypothetical protein
VSVDTYLRGKNTAAYTRLRHDDVEILLSPALVRWAGEVDIDVGSSLFRKRFVVRVQHRHSAACQH